MISRIFKKLNFFTLKSQKKIQDIFLKYVSRKTYNEILSGKHIPSLGQLKTALIHYVLIEVKDQPIERTSELITSAVEILETKKMVVDTIFSNLIVSTLGLHTLAKDPRIHLQDVSDSLLKNLGNDIKIATGEAEGLVGLWGTPTCLCHGPLIPNFLSKIVVLNGVQYGNSVIV